MDDPKPQANEAPAKPDRATNQELSKFIDRLDAISRDFNGAVRRLEATVPKFLDGMTSYIRTVITIGYASLFGVWAFTRDYMTTGQVLFTAIFLLSSVLCIVINEVATIVLFNRVARKVNSSSSEGTVIDRLSRMSSDLTAMQTHFKRYSSINPWLLAVALTTAAAGLGIMLFALVSKLWCDYAVG